MADKQLYITRTEGDDLYTELQRKTLDELQRLSGEVWTDFNPSDPGVTIADVVDYALTEFDYKLGFALEDYLAEENGSWEKERYGLFPPEAVYPSAPVTKDDYRRLILANFPMVEDVKVKERIDESRYDFDLRLSPFLSNNHLIQERINKFLNRHRNLCERIGKIDVDKTEELFFNADFEIEPGTDATDILVQIYWTAMNYIAGSVEIRHIENSCMLPMKADEWYDGATADVRADFPNQCHTENKLYWELKQIPGIVSFKTCYFKDKNQEVVTDFRIGYSLQIPETFKGITVRIGEEKTEANIQDFKERLRAKCFMRNTFRLRNFLQERDGDAPQDRNGHGCTEYHASYRDIYTHTSIANDFPSCYATSERHFLRDTPDHERARIKNFGTYLQLFDLVIQRGLKELDSLKELLSIQDTGDRLSVMNTLSEDNPTMCKGNNRTRHVATIRHRYMNVLDSIYGTDSNPVWLREFEYYGQTEDDRLRRRMHFLSELPQLIRNRFTSFDLGGCYGGENIPTLKKYLSLLLDFNYEEENSVGNILPSHNLVLTGDDEKDKRMQRLMDSSMIDDDIFVANAVTAVEEDKPPLTQQEKIDRDEEIRRNLPIFNSNRISSTLFREGIVLSNYNLVKISNKEWLLVFRGKEEENRLNLGRSNDKTRLGRWANTLCRFLCDLNRQCEAVYVVEMNLLETKCHNTVILVFTGWTARTHLPRFREECTKLARSVVPAHLKMETYWLEAKQMQYFEEYHRKWRKSLREDTPKETRLTLQNYMMRTLENDFASKHMTAASKNADNETDNGNAL